MLAAWLVFGLTWGALQWLIVPRIADFRSQLESQASLVLGVPVQIGSVVAHSTGLMPSFELREVRLLDAQGRVALNLPRVLAAVSPRSLWRLGFEQLYVDRPTLAIRRAADGRIFVAGLDFSKQNPDSSAAADWFFSQAEFAIHDGSIAWTDEMRSAPTLALSQVELVLRNQGTRHNLRLDATPGAAWGERFSLRGMFRQALLSRHNGRWQEWQGQLYAALGRVDVSELRRYADIGIDLRQGQGALALWADVREGEFVSGQADVSLNAVSVTLGRDLQPLQLQSVHGRLGLRSLANGFEFSTQQLAFDTADGLHWPGGNVNLIYFAAQGKKAAQGELKADRLDLAALAQIADRLPIEATARSALQAHAPKGLVQRIAASWQGPVSAPLQYQLKGLVSGLELHANAAWPGVRGANIEFDLNQKSGRASLSMNDGALEFPAVFDEALIPVSQLATEVLWQLDGGHVALQLNKLKFSNADAEGEAQIKWENTAATAATTATRDAGVIDLQGSLSRAQAARVYRYLPLIISREVREYVHQAVLAGSATGVKFKVRGELEKMPFTDPRLGEFRISANLRNTLFNYVPRTLPSTSILPWPALTQLNGELVFERAGMQVRAASARMGAAGTVQWSRIDAAIADLGHASVSVNAQGHGPLANMLELVNASPLAALTGQALEHAVASGTAELKLKLDLPLADLASTRVQGSVTLAGNELQVTPAMPRLSRARGSVNFSDKGFTLVAAQARMLGGDVRLTGGSTGTVAAGASSLQIHASGSFSAEVLRQSQALGSLATLAQFASGSAAFDALLSLRQGRPELSVASNLQGLGLNLPAPLGKSAEALLPLRFEVAPQRDAGSGPLQDKLSLQLGSVASLVYGRDLSGTEARVVRGNIRLGATAQEPAVLPDDARVVANIDLKALDLDAWQRVLEQTGVAAPIRFDSSPAHTSNAAGSYWPHSFALRTQELTVAGRTLKHVLVGGSRDGLLWRANLSASEADGYLEYRQATGPGQGRVYARLARLSLAASAASDVEELLSEQPAGIPALDVVVDDFELRGKRLGRLEVAAINRSVDAGGSQEWRLNKLNLSLPEAQFKASGNWASINAQSTAADAGSNRRANRPRRTVLNFKLDIANAGELLARFGMKDVVRKGQGKMEGQVAWLGAPSTLDYPSLAGAFTVDVGSGQFLKADPGLAKLLGVLSLQTLPRRLTLDFRDVFSEGFSFDFLRGDVTIGQGIARTNNLQMKGVNAAVLIEGQADIAKETQDMKVVVVPEINAGTASLIASTINPAIGLGTFLAQWLLRRPLSESNTQEFHIDGSWTEPRVTKIERSVPK